MKQYIQNIFKKQNKHRLIINHLIVKTSKSKTETESQYESEHENYDENHPDIQLMIFNSKLIFYLFYLFYIISQ